jgi:hypothetical protein
MSGALGGGWDGQVTSDEAEKTQGQILRHRKEFGFYPDGGRFSTKI